jgi:hypothetical protein
MADDKSKRGSSDRGLIALNERYEVQYWSKKFKVTPAKLRYAVKKVGHSAKKVEAYIKLQRHRARDKNLIALNEPYEVRYWSRPCENVFPPEKLHATGGGPRRHDRLSMFLLLRVCSQPWRNLGPR